MLSQVWLKFAFHLFAISSRDESIRTARVEWMISASQTGKSSAAFQINSYPDGSSKWNWPFTHGGQLLTVRESGSSPLAWLDEYKLTYSPSPPSSFALSLYGERGGTNPGVRLPRGAKSIWLDGKAKEESCLSRFGVVQWSVNSCSVLPLGGTGVHHLQRYSIYWKRTCRASYRTVIV